MLCLSFTFKNDTKIILELPNGNKIELVHFKENNGKGGRIGIEAPKDIIIYRKKRESMPFVHQENYSNDQRKMDTQKRRQI